MLHIHLTLTILYCITNCTVATLGLKRPVFVVLRLEAVEEVVVRRHNLLLLLLSGLQRAELRTVVGALN